MARGRRLGDSHLTPALVCEVPEREVMRASLEEPSRIAPGWAHLRVIRAWSWESPQDSCDRPNSTDAIRPKERRALACSRTGRAGQRGWRWGGLAERVAERRPAIRARLKRLPEPVLKVDALTLSPCPLSPSCQPLPLRPPVDLDHVPVVILCTASPPQTALNGGSCGDEEATVAEGAQTVNPFVEIAQKRVGLGGQGG